MWAALNIMPDIDPPADFRHNVILKLAQAQSDKQNAKRSLYDLKWSDIVSQLRASRKVAAVCAGVILTALLISVPKDTYRYAAGIFRPDFTPVTMPSRDSSVNDASPSSVYDMSAIDKEKWMSRKLIRNAVWTSVSSTQNSQNTTLYKIELAKNNNALVNSSSIGAIKINVYIAPTNEYNIDTIKSDMPSWRGLITDDSSITIPVIVDQSTDTVNLLITWTTNDNEYGQFVFLPSKNIAQSDLLKQGELIDTNSSLYSELRLIAKDFGIPVVVNSNLHIDVTPSATGAGTLNKELRNLLSPVNLDWLSADNTVYVDKVYTVNNE
jgi:hypothetical protein